MTGAAIDALWDALWEDLRHNASGRPSGLLIITRHRYAIEAEAVAAERARLREAVEGLYDGTPEGDTTFGPDEFWVDGEPYIRVPAVLSLLEPTEEAER